MQSPIVAGANLDDETWRKLRLRAIFDYCKWDPRCGDQEVLAQFPLILQKETVGELAFFAEALTREALAAEYEISCKPDLLARLSIPKTIQACLRESGGGRTARDVRVMRFDFHYTTEGWRISEVNADVPGGYVEASGWDTLMATKYGHLAAPPDPTCAYANAICAGLQPGSLVALVHATVYSEDRQVMVHLGRELGLHGMRARLASPRNLCWHDGFGNINTDFENSGVDFVVRLSPAEWLPEGCARESWAPWFGASKTPLSNPGHAIILQSKRFPLVWDSLPCDLSTWRRLLPETRCPNEVMDVTGEESVVKPAFGRVGEDVGIRGVTNAEDYGRILKAMSDAPAQWVAQRRFDVIPVPTETGDIFPCVGVYTVDGKFAGLYSRAARVPLIDAGALDIATLIRSDHGGGTQ
jgi:glutathionylspermidine synthase